MHDAPENYDIWGAVVTEVEVDVLTGEKKVIRVDLIEDTGSSVNPGTNVIQLFTDVIYMRLQYASMFVPGRPLQPRAQCYKTFYVRNLRMFEIS